MTLRPCRKLLSALCSFLRKFPRRGGRTHLRERSRDVLARLDPTELHETISSLYEGLGDDDGSLGFSLGADDRRLTLLLRLRKGEVSAKSKRSSVV